MSMRVKAIAIASLAMSASAFALSNAALAAPSINFAIQVGQFGPPPTMEFKFKGGKYVWEQKAINTQFVGSGNTNDNDLHWASVLYVETLGVGGSASFTGKVPHGATTWNQQGPITFPVSFLSAYQANFASFCESNGGTKQVVKQGLSILFSVRQEFYKKHKFGDPAPKEVDPEGGSNVPSNNYAHRTVTMPVVVVCGAKPASTQPRPGGLVQEKGKLRVTSIEHRYMTVVGDVTKPNPGTQCKRARLSVTLKTNQAGPVKLRLHTKLGNAPTQAKAIELWASHQNSGTLKGLFVANHQEWITVEKTTAVQTMAEDLVNPVGLTTPWKSITLHCTGAGGGGLANTPGNANPDGLPTKPKQPKRVFDGPGNLSTGKPKPTHSTNKPVIAPATVKTAPVPPKPTGGKKTSKASAKPLRLPAVQKMPEKTAN